MAFSYIGGASGGATATSASITHSLTIAANDLIVACINRNDAGSPIALGGGAGGTWIEEDQADGAETNRWSIQYKKATGSEPDPYTWTWDGDGNDSHNVVILQFRSGTGDFELDQASNINEPGTDGTHTALGVTTTGVAVAVAFVLADSSGGTWSTIDSPFVSLVQGTGFRIAAGAHRLMPSGGATGNADFTHSSSKVYSGMMLSFKEAAAGTTIEIPTGPLR